MDKGLDRNTIVDIPPEAIREKKSGQVWLRIGSYRDKNGQLRPKKLTIGKAVSELQMYPNKSFQFRYPIAYAGANKSNVIRYAIRIGLYAVFLSIGEEKGIYNILVDSFGIEYANVLVDFCMFSILARSDAAQLYEITMADQLLFSGKAYSDSQISEFFEHKIKEDQNSVFRKKWIQQCKDVFNIENVWLCIDGSNNDCDAEKQEDAEQGENKSGTNKNINGYTYVVSAKDGMPITYDSYRGSRVDCIEIYKILDELKGYKLKVKGVILDRNFANINIIRTLTQAQIPFVIMLKSGQAQKILFARYADAINMAFEKCVDNEGKVFGIVEKVQLFSSYSDEAYVGLFYDSENGRERASHFIKQVKKEQKEALQEIACGKEPVISPKYSEFFTKKYNKDSKSWEIDIVLDKVNEAIDKKGYSTIATSENFTAEELHNIYHLRDYSEKSYSFLKSQLGFDVDRTYYDNGHKVKMGIGFICSLFRFFLMQVALQLDLNANVLIRKINLLSMYRYTSEYYVYSKTAQKQDKEILAGFNLTEDDLQSIAEYETKQSTCPIRNPIQKLPRSRNQQPILVKQSDEGDEPKTIIADAAETTTQAEQKPKKHAGGRPKGSKNKKTLEKEEILRQEGKFPLPKRPVGRPKGSKNKNPGIKTDTSSGSLQSSKHPGGRPKGSKNKKTLEREAEMERLRKEGKLPPKRSVGRPKGSKNRKKRIQ